MKKLSDTIVSPKGLAGFTLNKVYEDEQFYIYKKTNTEFGYDGGFELFERRINTMFKCETIPGGEAFGIWAFQLHSYEAAIEKLNKLKMEILNEKK